MESWAVAWIIIITQVIAQGKDSSDLVQTSFSKQPAQGVNCFVNKDSGS